ncbi:oxidoreductase [Alloscardovia criceti]|uniref:oxidoreductase n=1 Tax=Alloscardovia criceti TaxID=356828 RepID=UPI0004767258|nr:NADPH dehydrogenase [Alloscardovia criceti]
MTKLLSSATVAGLELKNRVVMPPMCTYEVYKHNGILTAFHRAHYGARAIGQVGLIIVEATAVEPDGRLTDKDLGLWNEEQTQAFSTLVRDIHELGSKIGIQLGHGGRKAADAQTKYAPSALAFNDEYGVPQEMTQEDIARVVQAFADAARRAQNAGFDMLEIHGAHGYLLDQFLEPTSNQRSDQYGGSLSNRYRLIGEIVRAVRKEFTGSLWVRLSLSVYADAQAQNSLEDWKQIGQWLEEEGIDGIDVSTGGLLDVSPNIPVGAGYQVPFSAVMKEAVHVPVTAVGFLDSPQLAEFVLESGHADLIEVGRGLLNNPQWAQKAAVSLHDQDFQVYNHSYDRAYKVQGLL